MKKQYIDAEYTEEEFQHGDDLYLITLSGLWYYYTPGSRGYRNSLGVPEEPDEPPEVEFIEADSVEVYVCLDSGEMVTVEDHSEILKSFLDEHTDKIETFIMGV